MTAPIIYRWDDPGAPVLTTAANAFYEIIYGCLINGYSGKAAAGWTSLYDSWSVNGRACIKNAAQSGVLGMLKPTDSRPAAALYIADGMVDADTAIAAKSGGHSIADITTMNANSYSYQRAWEGLLPRQWVVIANENFVLMWTGRDQGSLENLLADNTRQFGVYSMAFGALNSCRGLGSISDAQLGNFVILGGYHNRKGGNYPYLYSGWSSGYESINHSTIDVGILGGRVSPARAWFPGIINDSSAAGALKTANAKVNFRVSPLDVIASHGAGWNGWSVGVAKMILVDPTLGYSSDALNTMNLLGKNQLSDVVEIDAKSCLVAQMRGSCPVFISLAEEDWS